MKSLLHYFPFFVLTTLLYAVFFHLPSTRIPPTTFNSGQQAVQLQFIELAQSPSQETAAKKRRKNEPQPTKAIKDNKQSVVTINTQEKDKIKIAKQKLKKSIQRNPAINDALIEAEQFATDLNQPQSASKMAEKTPTTKTKAAILTPESKRIVKKLPPSNKRAQSQGVLQEAIVVSGNIPIYPKRAILRNQQGRVVVRLTVTTKGQVRNPQIISSSGYPILDNSVMNFIKNELFMPAHKGEEKVTTEQIFSFRFELQ